MFLTDGRKNGIWVLLYKRGFSSSDHSTKNIMAPKKKFCLWCLPHHSCQIYPETLKKSCQEVSATFSYTPHTSTELRPPNKHYRNRESVMSNALVTCETWQKYTHLLHKRGGLAKNSYFYPAKGLSHAFLCTIRCVWKERAEKVTQVRKLAFLRPVYTTCSVWLQEELPSKNLPSNVQ